jgi:beta-phosphoglucomutase family hydrolase
MSGQRAVIWDMDGVLVDTAEFHYEAWKNVFDVVGADFGWDQFRDAFGMKNAGILEKVLGYQPAAGYVDEISEMKESQFRAAVRGHVRPLPGVLNLLHQFEAREVRQAVASSAPQANIDLLLDELQIRDFFSAVVSGCDMPGKPYPKVFLQAADLIGVPYERCVVIEDAVAGVRAAKCAGMRCVAVATTNPADLLKGADLVVGRLDGISVESVLKLN